MRQVIVGKNGDLVDIDLTKTRAIRFFCLQFMGHQPSEVEACPSTECPLWHYRTGVDPARRGKGGGALNFKKNPPGRGKK